MNAPEVQARDARQLAQGEPFACSREAQRMIVREHAALRADNRLSAENDAGLDGLGNLAGLAGLVRDC